MILKAFMTKQLSYKSLVSTLVPKLGVNYPNLVVGFFDLGSRLHSEAKGHTCFGSLGS